MTRRRTTTALIAGVFALSAIGAAIADEHDEDPVEDTETVVDWDDETHVLVVALDDDGDDETSPCDDVTAERNEEGELVVMVGETEVDDENPLPDGCWVFDGEGKDGKVNRGTVVSGVAKNLSPHDLDIPKGHVMREVAQLEGITKVKAEKADDDGEGEPEPEANTLERGNGKGKGKGHSK
jgi:hypothetical protein